MSDKQQEWYGDQACALKSPTLGVWLGYLGVPQGHPWHGHDIFSLSSIDVHGGVTYASDRLPNKGSRPDENGWWWVGFDCAHLGDFIPRLMMDDQGGAVGDLTWRDLEFVQGEIDKMREQADQWVKDGKSVGGVDDEAIEFA